MASNLLPSNIPLHCNICPKKPDFSDVSHLLTHIASKGHLSTYYKIKVRSATEAEPRSLIDDYDNWYARWNIEDLMAVRLNLKETRKSRRRPSNAAGHPLLSLNSTSSVNPGVLRTHDRRGPGNPRLAQRAVKTEVLSRSVTPLNAPFIDPSHLHQGYSYAAPMHTWPGTAYMTTALEYDGTDDASEGFRLRLTRVPDQSRADTASTFDAEADIDEESVPETSIGGPEKLKGILWPGMDMFDSALPEQKRKRNQKKDISVLEQLEATSREIEPIELIFTAEGVFRLSRPITGWPDPEDSPISGEEAPPQPKKIKRAPRKEALAEKEPNTGGRTTRKKQKRKSQRAMADVQALGTEEQEDDDFTYGTKKSKRKGAFSVYRDEEVSFDQPADMNYLTSGFHHDAQPDDADDQPAAGTIYRMGESVYVPHQTYFPYQSSYQPNPFAYESSFLPSWEQFGYDTSGTTMTNPLFSGSDQPDAADDEGTISVLSSQQ